MRWSILPVVFLLLAPAVGGHAVGPQPGWTRMVMDDPHDWGWESSNPCQLGHELNSIEAREMRVGDEMLFLFRYIMVKSHNGDELGSHITVREELTFEGPRGTIRTLLDTTAEEHAVFVEGVEPTYISPRHTGPFDPGTGTAAFTIGFDVGYRYEDLQARRGDVLTDFRVQAWYEDDVAAAQGACAEGHRHYYGPGDGTIKRGDVMPLGYHTHDGGYSWDGSATGAPDESPYVADGFTVERSTWFGEGGYQGDGKPLADFETEPADPEPGEPVTFLDLSHDPDGDAITAWSWDLGDGTTSTEEQPVHVFPSAGTYLVQLAVTDEAGKTGILERTVSVQVREEGSTANQAARMDFTVAASTLVAGREVQFRDASFDPDGVVESWHWSFGDGATSTDANPLHTYTEPGTYRLVLTGTDDGGLQSQTARELTVVAEGEVAGALADFTWDLEYPSAIDALRFRDASLSDAGVAAWSWDFGDGATSTESDPEHQYETPGRYFIRLTVTDGEGREASVRKELVVRNLSPDASVRVEPADPAVGESVRLVAEATDADGEVVAWDWFLGTGSLVAGQEVEHAFDRPGLHIITLTVTDDRGATATVQHEVHVGDEPLADASSDRGAPGPAVGLLVLALASAAVARKRR